MNTLLIAGNIFGYIGLFALWLQVVFGSRHIFKYVTHDTVLINKIHKFVGIYSFLLIFLHPLFEMMNRLESFAWIFVPDFSMTTSSYIGLGKVAFIILTVVWITSAIVREKIKWRPWKYLHLLAYVVVLLTFVHVFYIGTFFQDYVVVRTLWFAMLFVFVSTILVRLLSFASLFKNASTITRLEMVGDSIMLVTFKPKEAITPQIGQHVYIQTGAFKSEHPFTVMEYSVGTGEITLGIRKLGGLWDELLLKKVGDGLYVDGPYGVFTKEAQNTNQKVLISGGIGVTPFVDLVRAYGQNTFYINCNRKEADLVKGDVLKSSVSSYLDILEEAPSVPTENILVGRISEDIIKGFVKEKTPLLPYFVCGSPMFISIVKQTLLSIGVKKENIYYEELGF